jgi:hypothetical protein
MADPLPDKNWGKKNLTPQVCPDENLGNFGKMPGVKIRMKIGIFGGRLSNVRMKTDLTAW